MQAAALDARPSGRERHCSPPVRPVTPAAHHLQRENHIGLIDTKCSPAGVCQDAIDDARSICMREKGSAPEVTVYGDPSFTFPYVPSHLHHMVGALRAARGTHGAQMQRLTPAGVAGWGRDQRLGAGPAGLRDAARAAVAHAQAACLRRCLPSRLLHHTRWPCPLPCFRQVFELVKNSLRAVHDRFEDADDEPPPIRLVVAEGEEDVTIKVRGAG